jgi:hypothetical protein
MKAVEELNSLGVTARLSGVDSLTLDGLKDLMPEQRAEALTLAKKHKAAILDELRGETVHQYEPTALELDYARSLLVDCPKTGARQHCWWCSRCCQTKRCAAWFPCRPHVKFYETLSGPPASYYLVLEEAEFEGVWQ